MSLVRVARETLETWAHACAWGRSPTHACILGSLPLTLPASPHDESYRFTHNALVPILSFLALALMGD